MGNESKTVEDWVPNEEPPHDEDGLELTEEEVDVLFAKEEKGR